MNGTYRQGGHRPVESAGHSRDAEERRLERTLDEIRRQIGEVKDTVGQRREQVVESRTEMWQDLPHLIHDFDEVVEFTQHQQALDQQEREYVFYRNMLPRLERMEKSPYFGRIDFQEEGTDRVDAVYIGIAALVEKATGEHLVHDWRAPISGMFYDFEPGPVYFEAAGGTIRGALLLKRQYKVSDGALEYLFDTDLKIDDDILQDILGQNVDRRMRTIVQSIQREQNEVIRDEDHRLLIVQGPAGSGKTSIALHRIAYFLYRYRESMGPEHIAILSPNAIFNDYISNVLPELGEENTRQLTMQEIVESALGRPVENMADQMEYLLERQGTESAARRTRAIAFKASLEFLDILKAYVDHLEQGEDLPLEDITFHGRTVLTREAMLDLLRETYSYLPYHKRLDKLARRVLYLLEPLEEARIKDVQAELERDPDYDRARAKEVRRLARMQVRDELQPLKEKLAQLTSSAVYVLYSELFRREDLLAALAARARCELPREYQAICRQTWKRLQGGAVGYEDTAPLLYLQAALGEFAPFTDIRHVVVDETQDYSAVHFAAMRKLFKSATFTLLGDTNQAIHPYLHAPDYDRVVDIFGERTSRVLRLSRSYRNTLEIAAFAKAILLSGGETGEPIDPIERSGPRPQVIRVADRTARHNAIADDLRSLMAEGFTTVGVICRTRTECSAAHEALKALVPVELIEKDDRTFRHGAVVIPSYLAKGLEFDAVIIYDAGPGSYTRPSERKVLYTACTRALHRLHVYTEGGLSPLLEGIDAELYEQRSYEA